jgi:hypothetical protein
MNVSSLIGFEGEDSTMTINYGTDIARFVRYEISIAFNEIFVSPNLPEISSTSAGFLSFGTEFYYKSVYKNGKFWDVSKNSFVEIFGDESNSGLSDSPFLVYRLNFNQSGWYHVFHQANGKSTDVEFFIGVNSTNFTSVIRPSNNNDFYPLTSQKAISPRVYIPSSGINFLNVWRGNGSISLKRIVLFKVDSNAPLNAGDPDTVKSSFETFQSKISLQPGLYNMSLLWKNSKSSDSLIVSNAFKFVSLQRGLIKSSYPYGVKRNESFQLNLHTNISFVQYNGLVSFFCGIGSQRFSAVQNGTKFICELQLDADFNTTNVTVSLFANHSQSREEVMVTSNSIFIHFFSI